MSARAGIPAPKQSGIDSPPLLRPAAEKERGSVQISDQAALTLSQSMDDLLRSLIEKMILASKHRNGVYRTMLEEDSQRDIAAGKSTIEFKYVKTSDIRAEIEKGRNKERARELEERRRIAEERADEANAEADGADGQKKAKKKQQSVRQMEQNMPQELKDQNQRAVIQSSLGGRKKYSWLNPGNKNSPLDLLVPAAKPSAASGSLSATKPSQALTARELKNQQRAEQHAKKMSKIVNVEDALLVMEKDKRFRASKANMRWASWRDAKMVAPAPPKP